MTTPDTIVTLPASVLQQRGISTATIAHFAIEPYIYRGQQGIRYPAGGDAIRWKNTNNKGTPKYSWPASGDVKIYNLPALEAAAALHGDFAQGGEIWIVNGEPVVWQLHTAGILAISFFGEQNIPDDLPDLLRAHGIHTLHIAPDNDEAGRRAVRKLLDLLADEFTVFVYDLAAYWRARWGEAAPDGCDLGDVLQKGCIDTDGIISPLFARNGLKALKAYPLHLPAKRDRSTAARQRRKCENAAAPAQGAGAISPRDLNGDGSLNPRLIAAVESHLGHIGKPRGPNMIQIPSWRPHKKDSPGEHATYYRNTQSAFEFSADEWYGIKDLCNWLGIDPDHYGGLWADGMTGAPVAANLSAAPKPKKSIRDRVEDFALDPITVEERVTIEYTSDLPSDKLDRRTLLIKSAIGTGKTELLKSLVADKRRVLVVVHRQALAKSLAQRLRIPCYTDMEDGDIAGAEKLVICLNSLHKLVGRGGVLRRFDLVAFDEIMQQFDHLGGETFKDNEALTAYKLFKQLCADAGQVVGLDAGLTDLARDVLAAVRGNVYTLENTHRREQGPLTIYRDRNAVINHALNAARTGKRIAIATSYELSKTLTRQFADIVGDQNVITINRDNSLSQDMQDFLTHINTHDLPSVLIYTPSMGSGFDITQPVDAVYGVFRGDWFTAPDALQMLGRCRNTDETHVYLQPTMDGQRETDWKALYQMYQDRALQTAQEADFDAFGVYVTSPAQDGLNRLLSVREASQNRSKNDLLSHFVALCAGYDLHYNDTKARDTGKEIRAQMRAEEKGLTLASEAVDDAELDYLRNTGQDITPEIRAGHLRWQIEYCVGQDLNPELYDNLHQPRQRAALRAFTDLRTDHDILFAIDRRQAENEERLSSRQHRGKNARLIRDLLQTVFEVASVDDLLMAAIELSEADINARMTAWLADHNRDVRTFVDRRKAHSDRPLAVLRWLLGRVGIHLDYRQVRRDGSKFYMYSIDADTLTVWIGYSDTRRDTLASRDRVSKPAYRKRIADFKTVEIVPPEGVGPPIQARLALI